MMTGNRVYLCCTSTFEDRRIDLYSMVDKDSSSRLGRLKQPISGSKRQWIKIRRAQNCLRIYCDRVSNNFIDPLET